MSKINKTRCWVALFFILFSLTTGCVSQYIKSGFDYQNIANDKNVTISDPGIERIISPIRQDIDKQMNRVIAFSVEPMIKDKPESNLTNFVADLMLKEARDFAKQKHIELGALVSYTNYGGLRSALPQGEITVGKIFELMPFENELVLVKIKGSNLLQFANVVAEKGGDGVGGIRIGIKEGKASAVKVDGTPVDPEKSYWVVTSDYIANGGDAMDMFLSPQQMVKTGLKIRDVIIRNLEKQYKQGEKLMAKKDGRIYYE